MINLDNYYHMFDVYIKIFPFLTVHIIIIKKYFNLYANFNLSQIVSFCKTKYYNKTKKEITNISTLYRTRKSKELKNINYYYYYYIQFITSSVHVSFDN